MKLRHQIQGFYTILIVILMMIIDLSAQSIQMIDQGDGIHDFYSTHKDSDLHFHLFDDGYFSFVKNISHTYDTQFIGAEPSFFTVGAYEDEEVDDELVGTPGSSTANPNRQPHDFKNKVEVLESWNLVKTDDNYFILMFENIESPSPISGCVEWHYNNTELSIFEADILDNYGNNWVSNRQIQQSDYANHGFTHKIVWDYSNLKADEQRFIYIPANCLQDEMQRVSTRGVMKSNNCQFIPYNANNDGNMNGVNDSPHYTLTNIVRGFPHDPNCIVTDPYALTILDEEVTVTYRIYFQNEGTSKAINVNLNFSIYSPGVFNMAYIGSSDFCIVNQSNSQQCNILFPNINLSGMAEQPAPVYENTIGWVDLEVCFELAQFSQPFAYSDVDIIFDGQPIVTAENTIYRILDQSMQSNCAIDNTNNISLKSSTTDEIESQDHEILVYPNPCSEFIKIIPPAKIDQYTLVMIDIHGKELMKNYSLKGTQNLSMAELSSGIYFVQVSDGFNSYTSRVIKN